MSRSSSRVSDAGVAIWPRDAALRLIELVEIAYPRLDQLGGAGVV